MKQRLRTPEEGDHPRVLLRMARHRQTQFFLRSPSKQVKLIPKSQSLSLPIQKSGKQLITISRINIYNQSQEDVQDSAFKTMETWRGRTESIQWKNTEDIKKNQGSLTSRLKARQKKVFNSFEKVDELKIGKILINNREYKYKMNEQTPREVSCEPKKRMRPKNMNLRKLRIEKKFSILSPW